VIRFHARTARRHQTYNESTQNYALHGRHPSRENESETTGSREGGEFLWVRGRNEHANPRKRCWE
jgi:hypothetical protein